MNVSNHLPAAVLALAMLAPAPVMSQSHKTFDICMSQGKDFGECMDRFMKNSPAGCSAARKQIRRQKASAAEAGWHLAFAGRKDSTITGIRGCGFAWYTDLRKAQEHAMASCRKWETTYGTNGGTKTCRLMN